MSLDNKVKLDGVDRQLLRRLITDGRVSVAELAQQIGMSAPGVNERLKRLERRGVIRGFSVEVDLAALGFAFEAIVRIKPRPGALKQVEAMLAKQIRFTMCDKVTGDDCFIARLALYSITELDDILDPFHDLAETNTAIVKSSPVRHRVPIDLS
ncbi:Lrp/AsnC family transcriptional regulator [Arenicella xantha]|uniref:AsnC family transcriptional regulator n=1 Tax=Arenicella xantha TaxID=644221 RepID=A0A395JML1_9GAMM|nr:Lrp/AsnC family transcriptional regulator [Arenicella xantha]RBP52707.1 AsnC family transcriptional regulator [Arenicella xantha]